MICDFNGIKRMRLDSSDKEKNIQLEMERQCSSSAVSCGASALEPSSPTLDPARLKEAIEADRWEIFLGIENSNHEFSTIYFFFNNFMAISHEIESIF